MALIGEDNAFMCQFERFFQLKNNFSIFLSRCYRSILDGIWKWFSMPSSESSESGGQTDLWKYFSSHCWLASWQGKHDCIFDSGKAGNFLSVEVFSVFRWEQGKNFNFEKISRTTTSLTSERVCFKLDNYSYSSKAFDFSRNNELVCCIFILDEMKRGSSVSILNSSGVQVESKWRF